MKVVNQLRTIHQEATEKFSRLSTEIKDILKPKVEIENWFFLSRLKQLESFALKIETGRVPDPNNMEDFFACTIVVPTINEVEEAEELVLSLYDLRYRRPVDNTNTRKASSSFDFDDLRLYVSRRDSISGKNEDLKDVIFEVQVKTILQYAWGIATHDLIYKTDSVSWPRERIAYQVKAMLEHAEVAISEASRLSDARAVAKKDEKTANILKIIDQVRSFWPKDRLPNDVKRLAEIFNELFRVCDLSPDRLTPILDEEKRRLGMLPVDLSPYAFLVQALAHTSEVDFKGKFNRRNNRLGLAIHSDMDLPGWLLEEHDRIINLG